MTRVFRPIKHLRCNPDVCPCRTLQPPVDAGGVRDVDTLDDDDLHVCTDEDSVVAKLMFLMLR